MATTKKPSGMDQATKDRLADGRRRALAIEKYLDALAARRRRQRSSGAPLTPEYVEEHLRKAQGAIRANTGIKRVYAEQDRLDALAMREELRAEESMEALRQGFIASVKRYSERDSLSREAWLAAGVPAEDLDEAGM